MATTQHEEEELPLRERIATNPRPALIWVTGLAFLVALELGAIADMVVNAVPWALLVGEPISMLAGVSAPAANGLNWLFGRFAAFGAVFADLPTLLSRDVIPNQGHRIPGGQVLVTDIPMWDIGQGRINDFRFRWWEWKHTFLGLPPAAAWAIRMVVIYLYAAVLAMWTWKGYLVFREHYRYADWTPTDDIVDRLRNHSWGKFGLVVVFLFLTMAVFAPPMGMNSVEHNIKNPFFYETDYLNTDTGQVETTLIGDANTASASKGNPSENYGLFTYDNFDRFHPFGTLSTGKDLWTFIVAGARVSLFIGIVAIGISSSIGFALAMLSAYYKGAVDLSTVVVSDSIQAMPLLLLLLMGRRVLAEHWIADLYNGGVIIALLFGATFWPGFWRSVRGPSLQVVEREWVDAAKSYGQRPRTIMRKHMAPYAIGYMLIYGSLSLGGIIIITSALSFIGMGINPPTPEWGRAISEGQNFVTTASWHVSIVPGLLITLVVIGFNALGDGIRDAIDPQAEGGSSSAESETSAAASGGGG